MKSINEKGCILSVIESGPTVCLRSRSTPQDQIAAAIAAVAPPNPTPGAMKQRQTAQAELAIASSRWARDATSHADASLSSDALLLPAAEVLAATMAQMGLPVFRPTPPASAPPGLSSAPPSRADSESWRSAPKPDLWSKPDFSAARDASTGGIWGR